MEKDEKRNSWPTLKKLSNFSSVKTREKRAGYPKFVFMYVFLLYCKLVREVEKAFFFNVVIFHQNYTAAKVGSLKKKHRKERKYSC